MEQAPFSPDAAEPVAAAITPMMGQYLEIKGLNPGYLLFYRMGDFYEMFFDDAETASAALGIVLTRRGKHQGADIPMCGVPVHAAQDYLKKLIALGHRVAICEQVEDPAEAKKRGGKSPVKRDVVRLVTRGTITEDDLLPARASNFLAALAMLRQGDTDFALAFADVSTGELTVLPLGAAALADELARIDPAELLFSDSTQQALRDLKIVPPGATVVLPAEAFDSGAAAAIIEGAFAGAVDATAFTRVERAALGALLGYIRDSQKGVAVALRPPSSERLQAHMAIDAATRASLELLVTQRGGLKGSLLDEIDRCVTPAGSRLLARRLSAPLCDPAAINARLAAVAALLGDTILAARVRGTLKSVPDLTRALTRLALGRGGPRDLNAVARAIAGAGELAAALRDL
ncbi:MAG: DNA mismatch repair protein MutS, partial [Devosia sp.]